MTSTIGVEGDLRPLAGSLLTATAELRSQPQKAAPTPHSRLTFWPRVALVVVLTLVAYWPVFLDVVENASRGSRAAYLVVLPVLGAIIADRYRHAPRGVSDAESDWITALLAGVGGFTVLWLLNSRLPSTSGLWRLDLLAVVLWMACCTAIVLGVRYASRMAGLWLFILVCASPLPYLLATAYLGGTDTAAALVATMLGAVAVFGSGRATVLRWRIIATVACLAVGVAGLMVLSSHNLLLAVVFSAGINPAAHAVALHHFSLATDRRRYPHTTAPFPRRSHRSFVVLAVLAVALFATNLPLPIRSSTPVAAADWIQRADLGSPQDFPNVARQLGPHATMQRFTVAPDAGEPAAAVDVITTPQPGALNDFTDAVWYPSAVPVEFTPVDLGGAIPVDARAFHTNADATTTDGAADWYAVTWVWRSGAVTQQVTVIVNQSQTAQQPPAQPAALTVQNTLVAPALWIGRQQERPEDVVDAAAVRRAGDIARQLLTAANGDHDR